MKKRSLSAVILVASLLLAVTMMDTWILFTQMQNQTLQSGIYQLESVSGKMESTISSAQNLTMELAIRTREHLGNLDDLELYFGNVSSDYVL